MKAEHENSFDYLSEFELNSGQKHDLFENTEVFAELRFSTDELEIDDYLVEIGVSRATIVLETWGCSVVPGSRLNDLSQSDATVAIEKRRMTAAAASIGASLTPSKLDAKAEAKLDNSATFDRVETSIEAVSNVVCKSGKRWIVQNSVGDSALEILDGTYIANERLCEVVANSDANLVEVVGVVSVRKRDIVFRPEGNQIQRELRKFTHKEKFSKAVLAKAVSSYQKTLDQSNETGGILISRSVLSGDDDAH